VRMDPETWAIVNVNADESRRLRDLPYQEFLDSAYWRAVRMLVFERAGHHCQRCLGDTQLQVHHLKYKHHGREHKHLRDLILLCEHCHRRHHKEAFPTYPRRWLRNQIRTPEEMNERRKRGRCKWKRPETTEEKYRKLVY
jgi:5-methylcytosine-specific restriction endonuclease McrA